MSSLSACLASCGKVPPNVMPRMFVLTSPVTLRNSLGWGIAVAIAGMNGGLVSGNYARQSHTPYRNHYGRSENIVVKNPLED